MKHASADYGFYSRIPIPVGIMFTMRNGCMRNISYTRDVLILRAANSKTKTRYAQIEPG